MSRLDSIPNSYSAFTVYITLKEDCIEYINHTCYCQESYSDTWQYNNSDTTDWPRGFMYMTPPYKEQGKYARTLLITAPMQYSAVEKWSDSCVGHRGEEYEKWKATCAGKLISRAERTLPGLKDCIKEIYTSSPLTIRDYYNTKQGAMYGFLKDCEQPLLSQVPIYTKIKNLLLTGQNIYLHGICGVPLTAINTAEAIVGENIIIGKINENYKNIES